MRSASLELAEVSLLGAEVPVTLVTRDAPGASASPSWRSEPWKQQNLFGRVNSVKKMEWQEVVSFPDCAQRHFSLCPVVGRR